MIDTAMSYSAEASNQLNGDLKCPKCFARSFSSVNNDSLSANSNQQSVKFVYSTKCPHYLCINCKKDLYKSATTANKQIKCFSCQTFLKGDDYTEQTIEEYKFVSDLKNRQDIMKIFNKKRNDFAKIEDYDAYLEDVEDKIYILTESGDEEAIKRVKKEIMDYSFRNRQIISVNNLKRVEQLRTLEQMIVAENKKLNMYGSASQGDQADPTISKLLSGFKLDDLDRLGETQSKIAQENEQLVDPSGQVTGVVQGQQLVRQVDPIPYQLYRTDIPRLLEVTRIPSNNMLAQILASGGLLTHQQKEKTDKDMSRGATKIPDQYKMMDLNRVKAERLFKSGLI